MTQISFTVPGQPVGKARARVTRHGTYTPAATVGYEERIIVAAREAMTDAGRDVVPQGVAVRLDVSFKFQVQQSWSKKKTLAMLGAHLQKPDRDNLLKAVSDALTGVVYHDDCQVNSGYTAKWWWTEAGETQITVTW